MKTVAVMAYDSEAFQYEVRSLLADTIDLTTHHTRRELRFPNVSFMFVDRPERVRGQTFDAVLLFEGYRSRERWRETRDAIDFCMRG